jgi:hypothetical protein
MTEIVETPLSRRIAAAAREAFITLLAEHPDERFYFFALFTTENGGYVTTTSASEEGLSKAVARYAAKGSRVTARTLRFSAPDSSYHAPSQPFDVPQGRKTVAACFAALAALDREGLFGRDAERERAIVNVVYGDMSHEMWLAHAERLNPKAAIARALPFLDLNLPSGDVTCWGARAYQLNALSCSADRSLVAYSGSGGEIGVLRVDTRTPVREMRRRGEHWASVLSPDGARFYLGDEDGTVVLDVKTGRARPFASSSKVRLLALAPDERTLATAPWGAPLVAYDVATKVQLWKHDVAVEACAFSPDGERLAYVIASPTIEIVCVDARTGERVWTTPLPHAPPAGLVWHAATNAIVVAADGTLSWLDPAGWVARSLSCGSSCTRFALSPSGARIAHADGRALVVRDIDGHELARGTGGHEDLIACVFVDESRALGVGRDVNSGPAIVDLAFPLAAP